MQKVNKGRASLFAASIAGVLGLATAAAAAVPVPSRLAAPAIQPFAAQVELVGNNQRKKRHVRKANRWRVVRMHRRDMLRSRGARRGTIQVIYVRPGGRVLVERYRFPPQGDYRVRAPDFGSGPADKVKVAKAPADQPKKTLAAKPSKQRATAERKETAAPRPANSKRTFANWIDCGRGAGIVTEYGFSDVKPTSCGERVHAFNARRDGADYSVRINAGDGELLEVKKRSAQTSAVESETAQQ